MNEPRSVAIIGFLAAGALILTLGFCLGGRNGENAAGGVPPLHIEEPADGDTLANPVVVTFNTPGALRLHAAHGWTAGELHLHAMADSVEIMPGAADITAAGENRWRWRLPALDTGEHRFYLTWAGRHHGNLAGVADTIRIFVRP